MNLTDTAYALIYADGSCHQMDGRGGGLFADKPDRELIDDHKSLGLQPIVIVTVRLKDGHFEVGK